MKKLRKIFFRCLGIGFGILCLYLIARYATRVGIVIKGRQLSGFQSLACIALTGVFSIAFTKAAGPWVAEGERDPHG